MLNTPPSNHFEWVELDKGRKNEKGLDGKGGKETGEIIGFCFVTRIRDASSASSAMEQVSSSAVFSSSHGDFYLVL